MSWLLDIFLFIFKFIKHKIQFQRRNTFYFQNMCVVAIQNHNPHLDTVRSRGYIWLDLNNDIYSCSLHQRYRDRTL